jgi:hypothetical protein
MPPHIGVRPHNSIQLERRSLVPVRKRLQAPRTNMRALAAVHLQEREHSQRRVRSQLRTPLRTKSPA